ncbi:hypothetical protein BHM03_00058370 [Ensete ventricosum]|nr:hypothetical protein BHM03_00058370 [Ensete ventricosum]
MQFRSIPPDKGGTYRSTRLPVHELPAIGRYRQNRPSVVDFGRRRPIEGEIDRRRSIEVKEERRRGEEEKSTFFPRVVLARALSPPSPAGDFSPARGDEMSPRVGRKIEATFFDSPSQVRHRRTAFCPAQLDLTTPPKRNLWSSKELEKADQNNREQRQSSGAPPIDGKMDLWSSMEILRGSRRRNGEQVTGSGVGRGLKNSVSLLYCFLTLRFPFSWRLQNPVQVLHGHQSDRAVKTRILR